MYCYKVDTFNNQVQVLMDLLYTCTNCLDKIVVNNICKYYRFTYTWQSTYLSDKYSYNLYMQKYVIVKRGNI